MNDSRSVGVGPVDDARPMTAEFAGRTAVVTGAGAGIGAVIAETLAVRGARVVLADVEVESAERQAQRLADLGADCRALALDVRDAAQVRAELGRFLVDILVNNAAVCAEDDFLDVDEQTWIRDIDTNLNGAYRCIQAVLPGMRERRSGSVVNIASVNGLAAFGNEAYSAAKAGVISLTRSLAVRFGPDNVRFNAIAPGTVHTRLWDDRIAQDPNVLDDVVEYYPLGRIGTPTDVAEAVCFLASTRAPWITGVCLPVDGGLMAGSQKMIKTIVIAGKSSAKPG